MPRQNEERTCSTWIQIQAPANVTIHVTVATMVGREDMPQEMEKNRSVSHTTSSNLSENASSGLHIDKKKIMKWLACPTEADLPSAIGGLVIILFLLSVTVYSFYLTLGS